MIILVWVKDLSNVIVIVAWKLPRTWSQANYTIVHTIFWVRFHLCVCIVFPYLYINYIRSPEEEKTRIKAFSSRKHKNKYEMHINKYNLIFFTFIHPYICYVQSMRYNEENGWIIVVAIVGLQYVVIHIRFISYHTQS